MQAFCRVCQHDSEVVESGWGSFSCETCGYVFETPGPDDSTRVWSPAGHSASIGPYRVIRRLGRGGFGEVYLGEHETMGRQAAVKIPRPDRIEPRQIAALIDEARKAGSLKHANIVTIYEADRYAEGSVYVAMEYVPGLSLADRLQAQQVTPAWIAELIATVADAVHYAHTKGIFHRDLKPSNILLDEHGRPHVADFGLAVHEDQRLSRPGIVAGTVEYMSPEQCRGADGLQDGRTDIWSLGIVLYQALTGRLPFRGTRSEIVRQILEQTPKPLRQEAATIPEKLEEICLKCLKKDVDDRYTSAHDLAHELRKWLSVSRVDGPGSQEVIQVEPADPPCDQAQGTHEGTSQVKPTVPWRRRWVLTRGLPILAAVFALAAAMGLSIPSNRMPRYESPGLHRLLERSPRELQNPTPEHARYAIHAQQQKLDVTSTDTLTLLLGTTKQPDYNLRIGIQKVNHAGCCGLLVGCDADSQGRWQRYQMFELLCDFDEQGKPFARIDRITVRPGHSERVAAADVPNPLPDGTGYLEILVRNHSVIKVMWNATELKTLVDDCGQERVVDFPCRGGFGVGNAYGSTTFFDGSISLE